MLTTNSHPEVSRPEDAPFCGERSRGVVLPAPFAQLLAEHMAGVLRLESAAARIDVASLAADAPAVPGRSRSSRRRANRRARLAAGGVG